MYCCTLVLVLNVFIHSGRACDRPLKETRTCTPEQCVRDCALTEWSEWSYCVEKDTFECITNGTRTREREIRWGKKKGKKRRGSRFFFLFLNSVDARGDGLPCGTDRFEEETCVCPMYTVSCSN